MRGDHESPEFIRQSDSFHQAIGNAGKMSELTVLPGLNHFEMNEEFGREDSAVAAALRSQLALTGHDARLARSSASPQPLRITSP
jgi:hypothetical protein